MYTPHRFIGTDSEGNRKVRTDLLLLDTLSYSAFAVTTEQLIEYADPRNETRMKAEHAIHTLTLLMADGYVERFESKLSEASPLRWVITDKGRAHLIAAEAQDIFEDCAASGVKNLKPRIEEAPVSELNLNARLHASHRQLDRQGIPRDPFCQPSKRKEMKMPSQNEISLSAFAAYLRVEELDLDDWWKQQDVEAKGQIFMLWSLGKCGCVAGITGAVEERLIPIAGTIGDDVQPICDAGPEDKEHPLPNFMGIGGIQK